MRFGMSACAIGCMIMVSCFGVWGQYFPITPVYQYSDNGKSPHFFIEKPGLASPAKPNMYLKVGPKDDGSYAYSPAASLWKFLDPKGEAAAALNRHMRSKRIVCYSFLFTGLALGTIGNWQSGSRATGWYSGFGACIAGFCVCLCIPPVTDAFRLRIIGIHNRSIGFGGENPEGRHD